MVGALLRKRSDSSPLSYQDRPRWSTRLSEVLEWKARAWWFSEQRVADTDGRVELLTNFGINLKGNWTPKDMIEERACYDLGVNTYQATPSSATRTAETKNCRFSLSCFSFIATA